MKRSKLFGTVLLAISACLNLSSCSSEKVDEDFPTKGKEYVVSIGYTGEIVDIIESPLSRAGQNDLYGIQVYSYEKDKGGYVPYAYGLFNEVSNISIKLLDGFKYKFIATMVVDGKDKIYHATGKYREPFNSYPGESRLDNLFKYTSEFNMNRNFQMEYGKACMPSADLYDRPNTDRYYGEISDYIPAENGTVSINMKRTAYGLKFVAANLKKGKLSISLGDSPTLLIEAPNTTVQDIFATYACKDAYLKEDQYVERVPVTINWTMADGTVVPFGTKNVEVKRNKLFTVNISIAPDSVNGKVGVQLESGEMGDGGTVDFDGGGNSDTDVDINKPDIETNEC